MTTTDFAELHDDLRTVAADVLARGRVVDWSNVVDAGWAGLEVPDAFGGAGASFAEVAVICQELGRAAAATHYLGGAVLSVGLLNSLRDSEVRNALLADVAAGRTRVAAVIGGSFTLDAQRRLTGRADFVPDADGADRLLVVATDTSGADVAVVAEALSVTGQPVLDETRDVATVTAEGVEVADSAVLRFAGSTQPVMRRAAVAVACDSLGLAEAMLEATVSYVKTREQFGRPIGSFQAVKHACADMLVKVTVARTLVRDAIHAVVHNDPDVDAAVAMAKSYTTAAAVDVVGKALQLHGGIGYTWESGIHVYLKRATFNRSLFGSPRQRTVVISLNGINKSSKEFREVGVPVYRRILELFEAEGVNTLFGIPDPNFVHMFVEAEQRGWSVVAPHHEESAGFMAEAASRMTGRPGLCIGTLGPGVANIAGAMMCAKVENSPVVFLGGQRARITERRVRRGRIQFVRQEELFTPSVKYSASIEYADQTDEIVHEAIRRAMSGTPGPAYIEYPSHVILEELDVADPPEPHRYRLVNQRAGAPEVAQAAEIIRNASSPILLVGHGVHTSRSAAAVAELAQLMACPVIQTSGGTAFIPGLEERTFPYGFSTAAVEAVAGSDVCVALGTELGEPVHYGTTRHWADKNGERKWIYVEQDPLAIGVNRPVDVALVGDLRGIVPQLVDALKDSPRTPSADLDRWIKQDADQLAELAETAPAGRSPVHPARYVVEATRAFPADGIMVRDGGATVIFQWTYSQAKPHDVMWNQNFGHLGTGLPYAVGASVAEGGKRPVMLLTSDSAFLFHIGELETAARLGLPLVCVVGVDHQWGLEVGVYKRTFEQPSPQPGVHWGKNVRFDKIAEGMGARGEFVDDETQIGPAIERAFAAGGTAVIHVCIDPKANSEEMPNYAEFRTWYAEGTQ